MTEHVQANTTDLATFTAAGVTFPEHENELLGIDSVHDYLSVDRLFLDVYTPHADIRGPLGIDGIFNMGHE